MHTFIHIYSHVCIHTYIHQCTHAYIYIYIYAHRYIQTGYLQNTGCVPMSNILYIFVLISTNLVHLHHMSFLRSQPLTTWWPTITWVGTGSADFTSSAWWFRNPSTTTGLRRHVLMTETPYLTSVVSPLLKDSTCCLHCGYIYVSLDGLSIISTWVVLDSEVCHHFITWTEPVEGRISWIYRHALSQILASLRCVFVGRVVLVSRFWKNNGALVNRCSTQIVHILRNGSRSFAETGH